MGDTGLEKRSTDTGKAEFRLRRRKRRKGIRIDMTPMVDIAFLLLIFFMVTTVFRRPLAMEVNLPEPNAKVAVPQSNVMTLFVNGDDAMYFRIGASAIAPIAWTELAPRFSQSAAANPQLIVLVKIHRQARYERMVDVMDTLEDAHMQRFSLVQMDPSDVELLEDVR